ncbi:LysR substrate-binding domain-containing protein [Limibaculum sp. FT325]|uniref:LysR substrate-binding domain-containing protein n=1 Tax=Thermohalobaculum sediminis TaxID=2939436 RepID=UPI0020BFDD0E|nr:LysR substrate-binding domain-containing protein [Limibaculum sediminis]MCL5776307.1 LysR substrate-binding domain-containing protein [Limibaculum sediminis]
MNLRQLRTLVAIAEQGSFTAAGEAMGLSHSAVSLQMKALEDELGVLLADRSLRPPRLTDRGLALVEQARRIGHIVDEIRALGAEGGLAGSLALGVVPTALVHPLPPALARLQAAHPQLAIRVRSGLSGDLAQAVRAGELDAALVTEPALLPEGLAARHVSAEPLQLIASPGMEGAELADLIARYPFIWFSRKTWAGQQIERVLARRGLRPREAMEVDALDAVEALVRAGLGVSVVPARAGAASGADSLRRLPLEGEDAIRRLCVIEREAHPRAHVVAALHTELVRAAAGVSAPESAASGAA